VPPRKRVNPQFRPAHVPPGQSADEPPANVHPITPPDSPDIASLHASNPDTPPLSLSDMIADRPSPEQDLVTVTVRVPRYLRNALDLQSKTTRRSQQDLVTDALKNDLDPRHIGMCYRKARDGK
jgi:hypothetical protein